METFNFKDFEDKFLEYIEENLEFFEKCAEELTGRACKIKVIVEKWDEMNEINVNELESREIDSLQKKIYTISGQENADFRIFNGSIHNQLIIDLNKEPIIYESPCQTPLCFTRLVQECIISNSIYLIGSYFIKVLIMQPTTKKNILVLSIGKHFNTPDQEYILKSTPKNQIYFKKKAFDSIIIGRASSDDTIFISESSISRQHAEIRFNSRWEIKDTSKFGLWKSLHTSLTLHTNSSALPITNNLKLKFNGVILGLYSTLT